MDDKEIDKAVDEIEPVDTDTSAAFVENKETFVKPDGETTATPARNVIKEESGAKKWVLGGLVVLLLAGLGAFGAWAYMDAQNARNELSSVKTGLDAARADVAKLRADATDDKKPVDTQETPKTDKELITEAVTAEIHATTAAKTLKVTVNILKPGTEFAYVSAGFEGGGGASYILKKVDSLWVIVFSGQDSVPQATIDNFSIPAEYRTGQ